MERLTVAELVYMLAHVSLSTETRRLLESARVDVRAVLSAEAVDDLRDAVSDRLQDVGFDEGYEPTDDGRMLEGLIDKLFLAPEN